MSSRKPNLYPHRLYPRFSEDAHPHVRRNELLSVVHWKYDNDLPISVHKQPVVGFGQGATCGTRLLSTFEGHIGDAEVERFASRKALSRPTPLAYLDAKRPATTSSRTTDAGLRKTRALTS